MVLLVAFTGILKFYDISSHIKFRNLKNLWKFICYHILKPRSYRHSLKHKFHTLKKSYEKMDIIYKKNLISLSEI